MLLAISLWLVFLFFFNAVVLGLFCCIQKEKITSHPPLKKLKSLNDLDQATDDQEIEFLKLQVLEQQSMIDELTRVSTSQKHQPGVTAVSTKQPIISFFCTFQDREKLLRKKRHKRSRPIKVSVWFSQLAMFPSKVGNWTCAETVSIPCVQEKHSFYPMCSREAQFLSHVFKRTKSSLSGKLAQNISKLLQMEKPATLFSYIINNLRLRARRWNTQ